VSPIVAATSEGQRGRVRLAGWTRAPRV